MLTENDNLELLDGYLVHKMSKNPPHEGCIDLASDLLITHKPPGWMVRVQEAVVLTTSEPEPDLVVARGNRRSYLARHPIGADLGLVVEVADSSLLSDRDDKGPIYARAGIPCYWIINLQDRQIEVYTSPSGPTSSPTYAHRQDYRPGDSVPFVLDGQTVVSIPAQELLP